MFSFFSSLKIFVKNFIFKFWVAVLVLSFWLQFFFRFKFSVLKFLFQSLNFKVSFRSFEFTSFNFERSFFFFFSFEILLLSFYLKLQFLNFNLKNFSFRVVIVLKSVFEGWKVLFLKF